MRVLLTHLIKPMEKQCSVAQLVSCTSAILFYLIFTSEIF